MKPIRSILAGAGCALALVAGGLSGAQAEDIPKAEHALVPGMMQIKLRNGPWGYGCFFPAKDSSQTNMMCTIGRAMKEGNNPREVLASGLIMLLRNTPDATRKPLVDEPWGLNLLLSAEGQPFDQDHPVRMSVDDGPSVTLSWQKCRVGLCGASAQALPADVTQALAHGKQARFAAQKKDGSSWSYTLPLETVNTAMGQIDGWIAKGALKP